MLNWGWGGEGGRILGLEGDGRETDYKLMRTGAGWAKRLDQEAGGGGWYWLDIRPEA